MDLEAPKHTLTALALTGLLASVACGGGPEPAASEADPSAAEAPAAPEKAAAGPFVRVLGTAQDGGFPHAACACDRCAAARRDPSLARKVASLAVVLPLSGSSGGRVYLIDATPDLPEQLELLADVRDPPPGRADRAPVDGVLLTHAHMGHYLGLAWFGYESVHTRGLPVWATPRMARFLRENGPWSQLVALGNVELRELQPGAGARGGGGAVELGDSVAVRAVSVPHRDEYTDTVGFRIEGPRATVLYVPDTDSWDAWGDRLDEVLEGVDVALVDATFYSAGELPGREVSEIGHPLVTDSLERFGDAVHAGRLRVHFIHLNHSNPALDPRSPERRAIEAAGFHVAEEGEEIPL
jgi:pyrroloquinoline quinone biosynthesis protein B